MRHPRRAPFWIGAIASCPFLANAGVVSAQQVNAQVADDVITKRSKVLIVSQAHAAEGQVSLRLVMKGGAGADPAGASGLAHIMSHALWDSAMDRLEARAAKGDQRARSLLASMGGRQHAHRAATVDMRATTYRIDLTNASDETVAEALALLSEVRAGIGLHKPASLESALASVREELRGWTSPYLRVNQCATRALFEPLGIAPGPFVGRADELEALSPEDLKSHAFRAHWGDGSPTLIVAGDTGDLTEEGLTREVLVTAMAPAFARPPARRHETAGTPDAIVVRDPEIMFGVAELIRVERGVGASPETRWIMTPGQPDTMRESVLRAAGAEALKRRLELATEGMTGEDALSELVVMSKAFSPGVWLNIVHAMNAPGRWDHAMGVLATEIRRVEAHGYSEGEARLALTMALREFESAARRENAETSADAADRIAELVRLGEPVRTPSERLLAVREAIAGAGAAELRDATIRAFGLREGLTALAATGTADERASERALVEMIARARADEPAALEHRLIEPASAESLLPPTATEARALALRADPASGVLSATLANNLVVHHREATPGGGTVTVEITVGGGEIDEKPGVPRGITDAALSAWRDAATSSLSSRDIRDALAGADLRVRAWADHDLVRLSIRASRDDLETALALAGALLREPRVEASSLERWRHSALERASLARTQPFDALRGAMWAPGVEGDDRRVSPPSDEDLRAITPELAQAWLDDLLERGSVEVAIVGDATRADAMHLGARLLGSIPTRPAIVPSALREDAPARGRTPMRADLELDTLASHAAALVGFVSDAGDDAFSWAIMELAARSLAPRVRDALSGDLAIANEARAMFLPVDGWRGFSMCYTPMLVAPDRVGLAVEAAERVYETVALEGLSDEEFERARAAASRALDAELLEPGAWARALSVSTRRAQPVDLLQRRREALSGVDAASVQREIADRLRGGDAVRVVVRPAAR